MHVYTQLVYTQFFFGQLRGPKKKTSVALSMPNIQILVSNTLL